MRSERLRLFLSHCVESTITGRLEDLKEYTIGQAVFDRPKHYNPAEDPIVRIEARRLRQKLEEYYDLYGGLDPVLIRVPEGAYLAAFEQRHTPRRPTRRLILYAAISVVLVSAAAILWVSVGRLNIPVEMRLTRITSDRDLNTDPALSPDGALLAFASDRAGASGLDIWIQSVRADGTHPELKRVTDDPADDSQPAISPDKTTIAFRSERQPPGIYSVGVQGGPARLLVRDGRNPRFSPDGRWIAYWIGSPGNNVLPPVGKAFVMRSTGGASTPLLADFASATCPEWSRREPKLLVEAVEKRGGALDLWSVGHDGAPPIPTGISSVLDRAGLKLDHRECSYSWTRDALVISTGRDAAENLWRLPVARQGRPAGRLARLTSGPGGQVLPSAATGGLVALASRSENIAIWRAPVDDSESPFRLTDSETMFPRVRGHRLAYLAKAAGHSSLWLKDLTSGRDVQLTRPPVEPEYPQLCPGFEDILFSQGPDAFAVSPSGSPPHLLCDGCARVWQCTAKDFLYSPPRTSPRSPLYAFDRDNGQKTVLLESPDSDLANPQRSKDGWIAFHSMPGPDRCQIFVAPPPSVYPIPRETWIPVTDGTHMDRNAVWNDSSEGLYFLSDRCGFRCIWHQRLDPGTHRPSGPAAAVRHFHSARLGLSAIDDVGAIGLSFQDGYLYFAMADTTGAIWLANPAQ